MRTFIAIPLPPQARMLLGDLQKSLRSFGADVRWTSVPSIHLTLKFLGEIDPAVLPTLLELLRAGTASEISCSLRLHGLGGFPNLRNPRVIWCGLEGDIPRLESLQQKVERACLEAGFAPEERSFQPHLTLGRVRSKSNLQPLMDYIKIASTRDCWFDVKGFNIYQSILRPQGAVYTVLEAIRLKDN
jgi:2'-5' RNA ligase